MFLLTSEMRVGILNFVSCVQLVLLRLDKETKEDGTYPNYVFPVFAEVGATVRCQL